MSERVSLARIGAVSGVIAVVANVAGVVGLQSVPHAYKPESIAQWMTEATAHPSAVVVGAVGFVVGMLALVPWALAWRDRSPLAHVAAAGIALGAAMNAAASLLPWVAVAHVVPACSAATCDGVVTAMFASGIAVDALFNLLFGLGLVALSTTLRGFRRGLALVAGLATLPVALQIVSNSAAGLLAVAGPLWLLCVSVESVALWRARPASLPSATPLR